MRQVEAEQLKGLRVRGPEGDDLGRVVRVYVDVHSEEPSWVSVRLGPWMRDIRTVPLATAEVHPDHLSVPYTRAKMEDSPFHDPDEDLGEEKEHELSKFYELQT